MKVSDYLSMDDYFLIKQSTGSINGVFHFSADRSQKRRFHISGNWLFDIDLNDKTKKEAVDAICTLLFPILKNKIEFRDKWTYTHVSNDFDEVFTISKDESKAYDWSLNYKLMMK